MFNSIKKIIYFNKQNWKNHLKDEIRNSFQGHKITPDYSDDFAIEYNIRCSEIKAWLSKRIPEISDEALSGAILWCAYKGIKSDIMLFPIYLQESI